MTWLAEFNWRARQTSGPPYLVGRNNLLGLIWAHFEEEEEVLLPILDRTMSAEEFQREILDHAQH